MEELIMNNDNIEVCNCCENQCPKDQLQCGKGKRFFAKEGQEEHGQKHCHHADGLHCHEGSTQDMDPKDLTHLLVRCGAMLNHRGGHGRGQGKILHILSQQPEISQQELQAKLEVEAGSLSEIISKLEKKGLIERKKDEDDKRKMKVYLTDKGKLESDSCGGEHQPDKLYQVLSDEEKQTLENILLKLIDNWGSNCHGRGRHNVEDHKCSHGRGRNKEGHGHDGEEGGHSHRGRQE